MTVLADALAKLREIAKPKPTLAEVMRREDFGLDDAAAVLAEIDRLKARITELESKVLGATGTVAVAEAGRTVKVCVYCAKPWPCDMAGLFPHRPSRSRPASATGDLGSPPDSASLVAAVVEAERERDEVTNAAMRERLRMHAHKQRAEALAEALRMTRDALAAYRSALICREGEGTKLRSVFNAAMAAARVVLAGGTEPPETVEIGDDRDGRRVAEEGQQ